MAFIKRFLAKGDQSIRCVNNPDIQPIGSFLQKKFSQGINYNMKIVIRGDRNVGKSALLNRLKGNPFDEHYIPSTEIQVASIHWSDKKHTDVVKVEVWDVVDKGKPRAQSNGLKLTNSNIKNVPEPCLDANFLDVYQGAHGVILVMDMTKSWTFDYVCRELPRVPPHLPVLILSNCRDMGDRRTVTERQVRNFIEDEATGRSIFNPADSKFSSSQSKRSVPVQYCEASMLNGFGLIYVHRFFSVPFLCLKREVLRRQLQETETELVGIVRDLSSTRSPLATTDEAYSIFVRIQQERARSIRDNVHSIYDNVNSKSKILSSSGRVVPEGPVPTSAVVSAAPPSTDGGNSVSTTNVSSGILDRPPCRSLSSNSGLDDEEDEEDFVLPNSMVSVGRSCSGSNSHRTTNPKVISIQEDVDQSDMLPNRLIVPDTESWENVNLSHASPDSSDGDDNTGKGQGSKHGSVDSFIRGIHGPPQTYSEPNRVKQYMRREENLFPTATEQLDSSVNQSDLSLPSQQRRDSQALTVPFSQLSPKIPADCVLNSGAEICEALVQSIFSTHDEDALERFLTE